MLTTDVKPHIAKLQYELFMQLPVEKRFLIGLQMCEDAMKLCVASVKNEFPTANEHELRIEMLRRLKRHNPIKLARLDV